MIGDRERDQQPAERHCGADEVLAKQPSGTRKFAVTERRQHAHSEDRGQPPGDERDDHQRGQHEPRFVARPHIRAQRGREFAGLAEREENERRDREHGGDADDDPKTDGVHSEHHGCDFFRRKSAMKASRRHAVTMQPRITSQRAKETTVICTPTEETT